MIRACVTIVLLVAAVGVPAQTPEDGPPRAASASYTLDWYVLDANGGGSISSAGYAASVTIGQTVVGATADATRQAGLGFWFGLDLLLFADGFEFGDTSAWSDGVRDPEKSDSVPGPVLGGGAGRTADNDLEHVLGEVSASNAARVRRARGVPRPTAVRQLRSQVIDAE